MKFINYLLAIFSVVSIGGLAIAETYAYHPQSRLYLGGGYNPYRPNDGFLPCTDDDGVKQVDTNGAVSSHAQMSIVRSREEFYKMVNFSTSIAGSFAFVSGGGSYHFFDESAFQSDSLSWIVLFRSDYGRFVLKNPRLNSQYAKYSTSELYQSCGSEVVTEERRGVMVYALFTVKNVSSSHRREIEANLKASASGIFWNAKMESSYKSILATAMARSQVLLTVNAIGGTGVQDLSELVRNSSENPYEQFAKVPEILANYISKLTTANAVPIQYVTTHLSALRPGLEKRFTDFKTMQVGRLYMMFADLQAAVGRLQGILFGSEGEEFELEASQRDVLAARANEYSDAINLVYAAATSCFLAQGGKCEVPRLNLAAIVWPQKGSKTSDLCEALRYEALLTSCIDRDMYIQLRHEQRVPLCGRNGVNPPVFMGDTLCSSL